MWTKIRSWPGKILQTMVMILWLWTLKDTNAYLSVYCVVACAGIFALWVNRKPWREYSRRDGACIILFGGIVSFAVFLANYLCYISLPKGLREATEMVMLLGGFLAAGNGMALLLTCEKNQVTPTCGKKGKWVYIGSFAVIFLLYLAYWLYSAYPDYLTVDSHSSLNQIETGLYRNNHPFWFTMFVRLMRFVGLLFTEDTFLALGAFGFAQILILAWIFSYVLGSLFQAGVPKGWIIAVFLLYAVSPYNLVYAVTMGKDTLFSAFVLLWIVSMFRLIRGIGGKRLNCLVLALGCAGTCLMRTNGWFVVCISCVMIGLILRRLWDRQVWLCIGAVLLVCWILSNPVLSILHVEGTNYIEGLSLPLQQLTRVLFNEYTLPEQDMEMLEKILNVDKIPVEFMHGCSDPVKTVIFKVEQKEFLKEHAWEYAALWLRTGIAHPGEYLKAWIELTKGYWNGGYAYEIFYLGEDMPQAGILDPAVFGNGKEWFHGYVTLLGKSPLYQPFISIGLHVWILLACFILNIRNRSRELVLSIPLLIILVGLWVCTPVYAEFRYAYPVFLVLPLILVSAASVSPEACWENFIEAQKSQA